MSIPIKYRLKIGDFFINGGLIWFLAYNTYFGWNWEPTSPAEKTCDLITLGICFFGVMLQHFAMKTFVAAFEAHKEDLIYDRDEEERIMDRIKEILDGKEQ